MKIIDLLNKIANGEDKPKKVRYDNQVFEYREDMLDYYCYDYDLNLMGYQKALNDEVEILEEEKKIPEKLYYCEENTFMIKCKENSYLTREEIRLLDSNFKELGNKINEIIDYLKSKGE